MSFVAATAVIGEFMVDLDDLGMEETVEDERSLSSVLRDEEDLMVSGAFA